MRQAIFVADFFADQQLGGAELNDATLINWLKSENLFYERKNTQHLTENYIMDNDDKVFIISNFVATDPKCYPVFALTDYIIYEHDYKFLPSRNPINYIDFKVPEDHIVNHNFYENAKAVVCLGKMHREIFEKNLDLDNLMNINCSLFSDKKIEILLNLSEAEKTKDYAVINSNNPTKKRDQTIKWCENKGIKFDLISHDDNNEFLKILSQYKNLVFMTGHPEPTPRIAVEAKLMGVNFIAPKKLIGVAQEYWWPWGSEKIASELKVIREGAYEMFGGLLS